MTYVRSSQRAFFRRAEAQYSRYRNGLLDEDAWQTVRHRVWRRIVPKQHGNAQSRVEASTGRDEANDRGRGESNPIAEITRAKPPKSAPFRKVSIRSIESNDHFLRSALRASATFCESSIRVLATVDWLPLVTSGSIEYDLSYLPLAAVLDLIHQFIRHLDSFINSVCRC